VQLGLTLLLEAERGGHRIEAALRGGHDLWPAVWRPQQRDKLRARGGTALQRSVL